MYIYYNLMLRLVCKYLYNVKLLYHGHNYCMVEIRANLLSNIKVLTVLIECVVAC